MLTLWLKFPDTLDLGFAPVQRLTVGVNRVVAEHEVMGMLDRRPEDELRVTFCHERQNAIRFFEHGNLVLQHMACRVKLARTWRHPADRVPGRRLIAPVFSILQPDMEVVDGCAR